MSETGQPISLIVLEDDPNDAELLLRRLRQAGFAPVVRLMDSEEAFTAALSSPCDLVISDYRMPRFTGLRALQIIRDRGLDVPFIIVSGTIGEATAVEAMRQGATDYLFKDRLGRLGAAVRQALDGVQLKRHSLQSQRLEAIGALAGGIAHDLNNILAPVLLVPGLLRPLMVTEKDREMLSLVELSGQRGAAIIRQLLAFCRGLGGERIKVDVRHLVRDMADIMRETFPRNIRITESGPPDLWVVEADPSQLNQVLMNLCVNARDAMPQGGGLAVAAENFVLDPDTTVESTARPGRYVRLRVSDSGQGIPPDILPKIFEPFFTTKEEGKGTGLGLSTVRGIVNSHNGFLKVRSEAGAGTSFEVYLPAAADGPTPTPPREAQSLPMGGGELILFVDDEASIRGVARQLLERQGYRVLTAGTGEEAIKLFVQNPAKPGLIITDLMMPGIGGVGLIRAIRLLDPAARFLVISGLGTNVGTAGLAQLRIPEPVDKPFDAKSLVGAVQSALSG